MNLLVVVLLGVFVTNKQISVHAAPQLAPISIFQSNIPTAQQNFGPPPAPSIINIEQENVESNSSLNANSTGVSGVRVESPELAQPPLSAQPPTLLESSNSAESLKPSGAGELLQSEESVKYLYNSGQSTKYVRSPSAAELAELSAESALSPQSAASPESAESAKSPGSGEAEAAALSSGTEAVIAASQLSAEILSSNNSAEDTPPSAEEVFPLAEIFGNVAEPLSAEQLFQVANLTGNYTVISLPDDIAGLPENASLVAVLRELQDEKSPEVRTFPEPPCVELLKVLADSIKSPESAEELKKSLLDVVESQYVEHSHNDDTQSEETHEKTNDSRSDDEDGVVLYPLHARDFVTTSERSSPLKMTKHLTKVHKKSSSKKENVNGQENNYGDDDDNDNDDDDDDYYGWDEDETVSVKTKRRKGYKKGSREVSHREEDSEDSSDDGHMKIIKKSKKSELESHSQDDTVEVEDYDSDESKKIKTKKSNSRSSQTKLKNKRQQTSVAPVATTVSMIISDSERGKPVPTKEGSSGAPVYAPSVYYDLDDEDEDENASEPGDKNGKRKHIIIKEKTIKNTELQNKTKSDVIDDFVQNLKHQDIEKLISRHLSDDVVVLLPTSFIRELLNNERFLTNCTCNEINSQKAQRKTAKSKSDDSHRSKKKSDKIDP